MYEQPPDFELPAFTVTRVRAEQVFEAAVHLRAGSLLVWPFVSPLRYPAAARLGFVVDWLRDTGRGRLGGEIGVPVEAGIEAVVTARLDARLLGACSLDEDGRLRLRVLAARGPAFAPGASLEVRAALGGPLPDSPEALLAAVLGPLAQECLGEIDPAALDPLLGWARAVCREAAAALGRRSAARLSRGLAGFRRTVLLDAAFDRSAPGLEAFRAALTGDFPLSADAHVRRCRAALDEALGGVHAVGLRLPMLVSRSAADRWRALAGSRVRAEEDGSVFAWSAETEPAARKNALLATLALAGPLLFAESAGRSSFSFCDRRTVCRHQGAAYCALLDYYGFPRPARRWLETALAAGQVEAELALELPGSAADAWLGAPAERAAEFFDVYSRVAVAVQRALRTWLPLGHFADPGRFEDLKSAYSLLFYRSTRPTPGQPRSDFGHALVTPDDPGPARPWAARLLSAELARVRRSLVEDGRAELAESYAPARAGRILGALVPRPRLLNSLLAADLFFIDRLVRMGIEGRELAAMLPRHPCRAAGRLARFTNRFAAAINHRLRKLYGGRSYFSLGSLLLAEATQALRGEPAAAIRGTLRLAAAGREHTFANHG